MKRFRVKPGGKIDLSEFDPAATPGFNRKEADARLQELNDRLEALQEALWAEHRHQVLVVLQGMDTSGKDGTIRHVFEGVNPLGVRVAAFKAPTPEELEHDFLWRVHARVPGRGEMVIFNRSHYEDVLVARVQKLVPPEVWKQRYDQINDFERLLADTGTTVLKFFLHISKDEQKERLQARLDDPQKQWKFRKGDLVDRALWDEYLRGLRGGALAHQPEARPLVHRARRQEVVPQPGGSHRPGQGPRGSEDPDPRSRGRSQGDRHRVAPFFVSNL